MSWNPDDPSEQRRHRRLSSRIPATLLFDGGAWRCVISNISPQGAGLEPAIPAALGHMAELQCSRFSRALLGRIVNVAENRTNMAFELDSTMQYELAKFLATDIDLR
ncbi:MAG: PilZ domain-containing protein [Geminicoccaceae bacterium]